MEDERSLSLLKLMVNEGLFPSPEEDEKRKIIVEKLKTIVVAWAKKVAWQRCLPKQQIAATSATILTYGSYGLGVHDPESDIDALCVGPFFATIAEDFFIVLHNILKSRPEISEIHCVKDSKVPLMRFTFDGISVDLPYAQLKVLNVPENVDILNLSLLTNIDETSWKSLSGVRANQRILLLVPNLKNFQSMLRCLKLWAKRRGVYGNLNGFLGGVHLAVLAAFVCQNQPNASVIALISNFFSTYAMWPWPTPVMLQDGMLSNVEDVIETRFYMPIRLPCSPYEYCHSNVTKSTFTKIRAEFLRGHSMNRDLLKLKLDFDAGRIFEPFPYSTNYTRFVKIYLSAPDQDELGDWVGWVKSHFRCLLLKLEAVQGFCDPNPMEYADMDVSEPNVVFYWGLNRSRSNFVYIEPVQEDFSRSIYCGYYGIRGKMELSIVQASELPKNARFDSGNGKKMKACWKMLDYNQRRAPAYSQHLPSYFVGYVESNGDTECPSTGV
ncbi:nuclear poly(A) polymerase 3 [Populus alba]|uniref:Poly(A) polymerase n=2 Tax=Populus TaxID=3689 RepID=A0A4U5Q380_POPAL|nr:nuclear poly(A) polymerase 3 isoform X1 [Populus alba]KAJ6987756.1 nuclear poly(A) polymerase 3 isoform X1 [Populus alba x Populus x berolinensis]TKS03017.1 nuclear poly(A) polymerase 3 isoform X1 [Populus alba]